jgi:lysophospholipase L1-like esterase
MKTISQRLNGINPVWVVVPDKSTAYLHPDKLFWDKAEDQFHAPNVLKALKQEIYNKNKDLYPANETHLSTAGYLILGNAIYQSIRQQ